MFVYRILKLSIPVVAVLLFLLLANLFDSLEAQASLRSKLHSYGIAVAPFPPTIDANRFVAKPGSAKKVALAHPNESVQNVAPGPKVQPTQSVAALSKAKLTAGAKSQTVTPAPTPLPIQTPTPIALPVPPARPALQFYTVRPGDTLLGLASRLNEPIVRILQLNPLPNPDQLYVGQSIKLPAPNGGSGSPLVIPAGLRLETKIIPDSEAVFSPAYADFDVTAFAQKYNGYLARYSENVDGSTLTGPQIIMLIASRFSVGPRVLLTVLEMNGGWVTGANPSDSQLVYPMGLKSAAQAGLYNQAFWIAAFLNEGYYGKVGETLSGIKTADGVSIPVALNLNPGTVAVQNLFAHIANYQSWLNDIAPGGFDAAYQKLFGDPFAHAVEPLVPSDLTQPPLRVPWQDGETWFLTSGPHEAWADGSPRAALDFAAGDGATCVPSARWVTAAGAGQIVQAESGRVIENLSGANFQGSGWSLLYMHMAAVGRVRTGTVVQTGEDIGHPSCEGGVSTADHLHFARMYNGQWIPAGSSSAPMDLSGWVVRANADDYDGTMARGADSRDSCDCDEADVNGIPGDGGSQMAITSAP